MAKKKPPKKVAKAPDPIKESLVMNRSKSDYEVKRPPGEPLCQIQKYTHMFDVKSPAIEALVIANTVSPDEIEYWDSENLRIYHGDSGVICHLTDADGLRVIVASPIVIIREPGDTFTFLPEYDFSMLYNELTTDYMQCFPYAANDGQIELGAAVSISLTKANLLTIVTAIDESAELTYRTDSGWSAIFQDAGGTTHIAMPGQTLVMFGSQEAPDRVLVLDTYVFQQLFDYGSGG